MAVYRSSGGLQVIINSNAKKLAERDEETVIASGIPYTIIRAGSLKNTPGGKQGFCFEEVLPPSLSTLACVIRLVTQYNRVNFMHTEDA